MTSNSAAKISRAKAVRNAIAIARMEGGEPSDFCLDLLALYVSGDISGAEMQKRMVRRAKRDRGNDVRDRKFRDVVAISEAGRPT